MASKTDIANRALFKVGEQRVSNVETTNTVAAKAVNEVYNTIRDAVLSAYPWNFAIKRTNLAPDGVTPNWGWDYAYTMPNDFLSLVSIKDNPNYDFEGGKILTDEGTTLYIKYIAKITNEGSYSPMFVEAFAAAIAVEITEKITQSNTKKNILLQEYNAILRQAYQTDAEENPIKDVPIDDWIIARL